MHVIGILGAAGIAPPAVIEPARRRQDVSVGAVASRRPGVAADYARRHGISSAFDGYESLLADPSIDLVYVALPPSEHARWSIAALRAGKHVLCEKPFAMNGQEAREMVSAARAAGRVLMEGFHDRHHPAFLHMVRLRESGVLGTITSLTAELSYDHTFDPRSIRHDPRLGGGALMDLGCYPIHWVRSLMGEEPDVIAAHARRTRLGADESVTATLRFPSSAFVDLSTSMAAGVRTFGLLRIEGSRGKAELRNPVLPHEGHFIREWIDGGFRQHTVAGGTSYDFQLAAFLDAVDGRSEPLTGGEDAIRNMDTIDAIYAKAGMPRG